MNAEKYYQLFKFLFEYFWLLAIIITLANVMIYKYRAQAHLRQKPELKPGYEAIFRGYMFWLNVPWLVMGIGIVFGGVPSVFHYFRPQDSDPYVLAWFGSLVILWAWGTYWLFFKQGAKTLAQHPGAFLMCRGTKIEEITDPRIIKIFWLACVLGGLAGIFVLLRMNIPLPDFVK